MYIPRIKTFIPTSVSAWATALLLLFGGHAVLHIDVPTAMARANNASVSAAPSAIRISYQVTTTVATTETDALDEDTVSDDTEREDDAKSGRERASRIENITVVAEAETINVHTGPSGNYMVVGKLRDGITVNVMEVSADGAWYRVPIGAIGWWGWIDAASTDAPPATVASADASEDASSDDANATDDGDLSDNEDASTDETSSSEDASSSDEASSANEDNSRDTDSADDEDATAEEDADAEDAESTDRAVDTDDADTVDADTVDVDEDTATVDDDETDTEADADIAEDTDTDADAADNAEEAAEVTVPTAVTQPRNMNVRGGPSTDYGVVSVARSGARLEILGVNAAGDWYQVRIEDLDTPGWVYAPLTDAIGPIDEIPEVPADEIPEPPEPAPATAPQAASVTAASAPLPSAAPLPAASGFFGYGVQAHMLGGGIDKATAATADMGFNWIKQQVQWRDFEGSQGALDFSELRRIADAAGGRGISILFSVVNAPNWAREPNFRQQRRRSAPGSEYIWQLLGPSCGRLLRQFGEGYRSLERAKSALRMGQSAHQPRRIHESTARWSQPHQGRVSGDVGHQRRADAGR